MVNVVTAQLSIRLAEDSLVVNCGGGADDTSESNMPTKENGHGHRLRRAESGADPTTQGTPSSRQ